MATFFLEDEFEDSFFDDSKIDDSGDSGFLVLSSGGKVESVKSKITFVQERQSSTGSDGHLVLG